MRERTSAANDADASAPGGRAVAAIPEPPDPPESVPPLDIDGVSVRIARPKRVRSASDVIRLLIGTGLVMLGIVLATIADDTVGGAQADLIDEIGRIPSRLQEAVIGVAQVLGASVVLAIVGVLAVRLEWRRLGVLLLGSIVATLAMHLVAEALELPETTRAIADNAVGTGWIDDPGFPSSGYLASSAAVVTLAGVWLSRRWKRALWAAVIVLAILRLLSSATGALDVVLAIAVGVVVGSLALVAFGAPNRAPDAPQLVELLRSVVPNLRGVRSAAGGTDSHAYELTTDDGRALFAKLRTPEDRSADYLARWYRSLRLRGREVEPPYATAKRRIEHEMLALRTARDYGASTPDVIGVGASADGSAVLVTTRIDGQPLTELGPGALDATLLEALWREVDALNGARVSHRNLALENVIVDASRRPHLIDFDDAELAADGLDRARDVAQVLVETSLLVGAEPAVAAACEALGPARVGAALPLLQPLALPRAIRSRLRKGDVSLEDLRLAVCRQTGVEEVALERLERIKPRTLFAIVAMGIAFYFLLPQLANLGDTVDAFQRADVEWLLLVLLGSALTYVFAAVAFAGSVAERVPFGAALRSRIASSFVSSFTPAGTGGMALGVRVLQRTGVDPASAAASVGINQAAGVFVHVVLLVAFVSWTGRSGVGGFSLPDSTVLLLGLAVVLGIFGVALLFRKVRRIVVDPALRAVRAAASEIAGVFRSPLRVGMLFGGAAGTTLAYVLAFAAAVEAFGGGLSFPQIGAAYLGASIVGNAAPTPGGLGAVEAALVAALTGFGMASGPAVSAVLTFRLATYWLPTAPGWFTFTWMQAREEI
jgi:glycosyltransferase 2 family protein